MKVCVDERARYIDADFIYLSVAGGQNRLCIDKVTLTQGGMITEPGGVLSFDLGLFLVGERPKSFGWPKVSFAFVAA